MKVYVYAQHVRDESGEICENKHDIDSDNTVLWADEDEETLIEMALERLAVRRDDGTDEFDWQCCRSVLAYLDGPEIQFDDETGTFLPVSEWDD